MVQCCSKHYSQTVPFSLGGRLGEGWGGGVISSDPPAIHCNHLTHSSHHSLEALLHCPHVDLQITLIGITPQTPLGVTLSLVS